jgi:hypothetical protein
MKEHLMSEIRKLTQRIGQASRGGVTEEAERLRVARSQLATRLARDFDTWLLVNAQGRSEFVDRATFRERAGAWLKRRREQAQTFPAAPGPIPSGESSAPATDLVRELFGEPISVYTRAQALEDGVLVDITPWASGCFSHPVALTQALWTIVSDYPPGHGPETLGDRVKELLGAAVRVAQESSRPSSQFTFPFLIATSGGLRTLELLAHSGPGDQGEPVITIGFPNDF